MLKTLTALCVVLLLLGGCSFFETGQDTAFHALIVGIDLYQDPSVPDLSYCKSDANGMRSLLLQNGWDDSEITILLDGEAEIVISGVTFNLKVGEMIIMPANKPHAVRARKRFKMILTMIK